MSSILHNVSAMGASYQLGLTNTGMNATINRLTTGKKINMASDDASGLVIANGLKSDTLVDSQAQANANNLLAQLQTDDGTLNEATNLVTRMAELAEEAAANGAKGTPLDAEFQSIVNTFNKLVGSIDGGGSATTLTTALGSYGSNALSVSISSVSASLLTGINLLNQTSAVSAKTAIQGVLDAIGLARGGIGAGEESLQAFSNVLGVQNQNQTSQLGTIQDANVADEVVNLTKWQILNQSGISALSKANQAGQSVLTLLQ